MNYLEALLPVQDRPDGYSEVLCASLTLVASGTGRIGQDSHATIVKIIRHLDKTATDPFVATAKLRKFVNYTKPENQNHLEALFKPTADFSKAEKRNILLNCLRISTHCLGAVEHHGYAINKIGRFLGWNSKTIGQELERAKAEIEGDFDDLMTLFHNYF